MLRANVLTNSHFGARVRRYHTWPMHHEQTVGEHTLQMMRIWWLIFGPLPGYISTWILWHDMGELVGGDPPYPVKVRNPDLKAGHDRVEREAVAAMRGPSNDFGLSEVDQFRVKLCDLLEMWETGLVELQMGNKFATPIVEELEIAVLGIASKLATREFSNVKEHMRVVMEKLGCT